MTIQWSQIVKQIKEAEDNIDSLSDEEKMAEVPSALSMTSMCHPLPKLMA